MEIVNSVCNGQFPPIAINTTWGLDGMVPISVWNCYRIAILCDGVSGEDLHRVKCNLGTRGVIDYVISRPHTSKSKWAEHVRRFVV